MRFVELFVYLILLGFGTTFPLSAQVSTLYEQATETSGLVIQYGQDIRAVLHFYSPMLRQEGGFSSSVSVLNSPEQRNRLEKVDREYLEKLKKLDFKSLSQGGKVDYVLLKRAIEDHLLTLDQEKTKYTSLESYLPFANKIYALEKMRRRGDVVDGKVIAAEMTALSTEVETAQEKLKEVKELDKSLTNFGEQAIRSLKLRLKSTYEFYNSYDPAFTWWVPVPYKGLDSVLTVYSKTLAGKGKLSTTQKEDKSGIKGVPIGKEELLRQLKAEMIMYTPDELIALANKEFAWCDAELLKASREMGFGDDWKKAQEKVKNSYVPEGQQPALILKLYNDAKTFIEANNLLDYPEMADETWGMQMMTPERQLTSPFFLGGRDIIISYPTNAMEHTDKLMSMRGNNPYFSRATVHHELVPGHHLQYYMNSRYKTYRSAFRTPFWTEGWALYWELLLYDKGFAKTPEERIGMLFWRMHRCARIIFSLNYHMGEWSPQECIDFLVDRVGHERANAEGEVRRSFEGNYGPLYQLAYLVGGLQIWGLKKELVDSKKMTYKQFHTAFMKENSLPIEMVRATLTNQPLTPEYKPGWKFYSSDN